MSKKKQQLVIEILSDKDWEEHIPFRDGMVLADIYSEAFGPSAAMLLRTKQFKVEHPQGELLTLAAVNADGVEVVKRFKGHSEPTFMFLVNGLMVNMYIGCNAPVFERLLNNEFNRELGVRQGIGHRKYLPFDKPTQAEIERDKRLFETANAEHREEEERRQTAFLRIRERAYEQISQALQATTVVLFLPLSVAGEQLPELAGPLKEQWAKMGIDVVRENSIIIHEEMANEIFYQRKLPQHKELVEVLRTGYSIVMLLKKVRPAEGEEDKGGQGDAPSPDDNEEEPVGDTYQMDLGLIEKIVAETVYGFYPDSEASDEEEQENPPVAEDSTEEEEDEEEEDEYWGEGRLSEDRVGSVVQYLLQPKEMTPPAGSPAAQLIRRLSGGVNIPGIYAPFTPYSKSAAVRVLFPTIAEPLYVMEELPPEPPPYVVVVFDAVKRDEVMEISADNPGNIIKMGFFNEKKQRLVDTVEEYNKLKRGAARDKFVLSINRTTSAPVLAFAGAGPIYVSPNQNIAKDDDKEYFGIDNIADSLKAMAPPEIGEPAIEDHTQQRQGPVAVSEGEEDEEELTPQSVAAPAENTGAFPEEGAEEATLQRAANNIPQEE